MMVDKRSQAKFSKKLIVSMSKITEIYILLNFNILGKYSNVML